jgi:hypothetical protein
VYVRVSGHEVGRESMDGVYRFTVGSAKCVDDCLMDLLSSLLPRIIFCWGWKVKQGHRN